MARMLGELILERIAGDGPSGKATVRMRIRVGLPASRAKQNRRNLERDNSTTGSESSLARSAEDK